MKQQTFSFAGRASNPTKASPAQLAARKRFSEMARSGAFKKATKRKANPTKNETIFKTGDMVTTDKGELGQVSYKKVQPGGYADVYRLLDVKANDPYKQTFLENGNFINGTRLKKATKRKANPSNRPIIKAAMNIRELAYDLENISQDDKKQISDYTDAEILHEAKYVLEIYHESGTVSNDALMGEHGKEEQKSARDDVRKLKALIKKFGTTTQRKTNPAKKTVSQKVSQLVHEGYPQRQAIAVALSEQRAGKVKRNPDGLKFQVGKYYETRSIGDYNIKIGATIVSRTDKTVTVKGTDSQMKSNYRLTKDHNGNEMFYPWGRYSMAPMIGADDEKRKTNPSKVKHVIEYKGHKDFSMYGVREPGSNKFLHAFSERKKAIDLAQKAADHYQKSMEVVRFQAVRPNYK